MSRCRRRVAGVLRSAPASSSPPPPNAPPAPAAPASVCPVASSPSAIAVASVTERSSARPTSSKLTYRIRAGGTRWNPRNRSTWKANVFPPPRFRTRNGTNSLACAPVPGVRTKPVRRTSTTLCAPFRSGYTAARFPVASTTSTRPDSNAHARVSTPCGRHWKSRIGYASCSSHSASHVAMSRARRHVTVPGQ